MQVRTYRSSSSQPAPRRGVQRGDLHCFSLEQLKDPQLLGLSWVPLQVKWLLAVLMMLNRDVSGLTSAPD